MRPPFSIRDAVESDLAAVQAIYAWNVAHGTGTFEEVAPDHAEMTRRWRDVRANGLPWLVAVSPEGAVLGYAYAGLFRARSAYRFTCEDSIYLAPEAQRQGLGSALLQVLIDRCTAAGRRQMFAVIGDSANAGSIKLHRRFGFADVGTMRAAGLKFGRWLDVVIMQLELGEGSRTLPTT